MIHSSTRKSLAEIVGPAFLTSTKESLEKFATDGTKLQYPPDAVDVNAIRFGKNLLSKLKNKTKIISKHKADDIYPIVGAASILAKTVRDKEIFNISKILEKKLDIPIGSGYPSDPVTKHFLDKWFETYGYFPPYIRNSWKTTQNILKKYKNSKLNSY